MKNHRLFLSACLLFLVLAGFMNPLIQNDESCGKDRWAVKTLTDPDIAKIKFKPILTTVSAMRALVPIQKSGNQTPRFGEEFNTYSVICKIREFLVEADGDYHIVLMDLKDTTLTMIAEIPDTNCTITKQSKYFKKFASARISFEKYQTGKGMVQPGMYKLTGVCFFDHIHGQKGVSKTNGIEIHPVLSFSKIKQGK